MSQRRRILITGASMGLGEEFARQYAAKGCDLVLCARSADKLSAIAADLGTRYGIEVDFFSCDLSTPDAAHMAFESATSGGRSIDMVINNAGFGWQGQFSKADTKRSRDMIEVNISALTELCRLFSGYMSTRRSGHIVNVASVAGFMAGPYMSEYYATKAYVVSLSEGLAVELQGSGVRVSVVCPGPTRTEFQTNAGMNRSLLFTSPGIMSAVSAVRESIKRIDAGRVHVIPGFFNRMTVLLTRLSPRMFMASMAGRLNQNASEH